MQVFVFCFLVVMLGGGLSSEALGAKHSSWATPHRVGASDTTTTDTTAVAFARDLDEVVVAATRGARLLDHVSAPTTLVERDEWERSGATRLSEVLAQQTGLRIVNDHGTGLQMQGFDPEYTLILVDGQPLVGRTAGTLDLDRLSVQGIERVEIIRGPSSSLYGSEALAGVVNLITESPTDEGLRTRIRGQYGSHDTSDFALNTRGTLGEWQLHAALNRYASGGYDLNSDAIGNTTPQFADYTARVRIARDIGTRTTVQLDGRLAHEQQDNVMGVGTDNPTPHNLDETRTDWHLTPSLLHKWSNGWKVDASYHAARYQTDSKVQRATDGVVTDQSAFQQFYGKAETELTAPLGSNHLLTVGGGHIRESLLGDRYEDGRQSDQGFAFVQHEWAIASWADVNTSARFDAHSAYTPQLSPRAGVVVRPVEGVRLRASVGRGFKAPAFRQLYLNFTNPVVGYSVLGAEEAAQRLQELQQEGVIARVQRDPGEMGSIDAESSWAYNIGGRVTPIDGVRWSVNLFRNDVSDLIDTVPIATRTNGQSVFSYINRNRIRTQGVETDVQVDPLSQLTVAVGYQFLDAVDRDVLDGIDEGRFFVGSTVARNALPAAIMEAF